MPQPGWKSISLPEEMVEEIARIIRERPELGYKSVSSFVIAAIRRLIEETKPTLEHFNVYEDHVTIIDHKRRRLVNVYFRNGRIYCELCQETECPHTQYALNIPKIQEALREKGWIIKEGKVIRKPF